MLLYHPSNTKFDIVKVKYFGYNDYTLAEKKSCSIERSFYYFNSKIPEKRFAKYKYVYVIKIKSKKLYDLRTDKKKLIQKYNTLNDLMIHLKRYYTGAIYKPNGYSIVCIFKDMKPIKIIERR